MTGIAAVVVTAVLAIGLTAILRRVRWQEKLKDPIVVAAVVAASATFAVAAVNTVGSVVSGSISASYQEKIEAEKLRANILLSVLQQYEQTLVPERNEANQKNRMKVLIQSGIVSDSDGSICKAIGIDGCPIKILKNN